MWTEAPKEPLNNFVADSDIKKEYKKGIQNTEMQEAIGYSIVWKPIMENNTTQYLNKRLSKPKQIHDVKHLNNCPEQCYSKWRKPISAGGGTLKGGRV